MGRGWSQEVERKLLECLNQKFPAASLVLYEDFVGFPLDVEQVGRVLQKREELGGKFHNIQEVFSTEGICAKELQELLANLTPPPPPSEEIPEGDRQAILELWESMPSPEQQRFLWVYGWRPEEFLEAYYTTLSSAPAGLEVEEKLVWREFRKRVALWLAKRGIVTSSLALSDGPLPIGDLLALGVSLWTLAELLWQWSRFWEEAVHAVTIAERARKAWELVATIEEHLRVKLPRQPICTGSWHYYMKEIAIKLKDFLRKVSKVPKSRKKRELVKKSEELLREYEEKVHQAEKAECADWVLEEIWEKFEELRSLVEK